MDASTGTSDTMPQNMAVFNPWLNPRNVVHRGDPKLFSFNANANVNRGQPSRFSAEALLNHSISMINLRSLILIRDIIIKGLSSLLSEVLPLLSSYSFVPLFMNMVLVIFGVYSLMESKLQMLSH